MVDRTGTGKPIGTVLSDKASSLLYTFDTATAVTKGRQVYVSAHRTVTQFSAATEYDADADLKSIGIATETVASGDECLICLHGIIIAEAGADVTLGQWMISDTSGRVVDGSTGLKGTGTTVIAATSGAQAEGYAGVGILILKDATAAAGDGVGVWIP